MRVTRFLAVALLLSTFSGFIAWKGAAQTTGAPLTNQDIVALTAAGLPDDVIVAKIHQAPSVAFDTSVTALTNLKTAGVSSGVIRVMIDPKAVSVTAASAVAPAKSLTDIAAPITEPQYVGIVFYLDSTGKLTPLEKQPINTEFKTKYLGFGGAQSSVMFKGAKSETRFKAGQPLQFVVRLNAAAGTDPSSLVDLDVLKVTKDERLIVAMKVGAMGLGGAKSKSGETQRTLTFVKYGEQSFLISPASPLEPGEYVVTTSAGKTAFLFGIDPQ